MKNHDNTCNVTATGRCTCNRPGINALYITITRLRAENAILRDDNMFLKRSFWTMAAATALSLGYLTGETLGWW